jgi:hypothetical protein
MPKPQPRFDKQTFFKDLGYTPHPGQLEIHLDQHSRRVVACGVRWGKTMCAAMEGLAAAMAPRKQSMGWVAAPTYDLANKVFRVLVHCAHEHLKYHIVRYSESSGVLVLRNMAGGLSEIRAMSADNPVSLLGEGLDWLIVDEASRLKPEIWQSHLSQRLIDKKGWALLISTPNGKGYFHELYRLGQGHDPAYRSWNYPSWTNPLLDAKLIEDQRRQVPERVFHQEYGAQFIDGAGAVFRYVREAATGELQEPVEYAMYFAGLDLAKTEDYTVLVILDRQGQVVAMDRFHRLDWSIQVQRICAMTERYNNAEMCVDSTGVGEPIYEELRKAGCNARAYPFTVKSKAALIEHLSIKLEKRELVLPRTQLMPQLVDELEAFAYSVTDQGNHRSAAPYGFHDDCVIALGLAAWSLKRGNRPLDFGAPPELI